MGLFTFSDPAPVKVKANPAVSTASPSPRRSSTPEQTDALPICAAPESVIFPVIVPVVFTPDWEDPKLIAPTLETPVPLMMKDSAVEVVPPIRTRQGPLPRTTVSLPAPEAPKEFGVVSSSVPRLAVVVPE